MVKSTITLEEFLRSGEVIKAIVEYIIFKRACTSLSIYVFEETHLADYIALQNKYFSELLISKICKLPACKKNHFPKKLIEEKVKSLLKDLTLSTQKNDQWAMQYLAHFFQNHSRFQLFFYDSPFYALKDTAFTASASRPDLRVKISYLRFNEHRRRFVLLTGIGIPENILVFITISQCLFAILNTTICYFMFLKFINLLPPLLVEEPILTYLNAVIAGYCSYLLMTKLLRYIIQNSPYSWNAAGPGIQMGLIEEIDAILLPPSITHQGKVKCATNSFLDDIDSEPLPLSKTVMSSNTAMPPSFTQEQKFLPSDEAKLVEKRKHQSSLSQSMPSLNDTIRVKISWEDTAIEPLEGVVVEKGKNKFEIDIIPKLGYSRGWSENKSMNVICRNHFFYQPEIKNPSRDPIDAKFSNIISLGHVVPPTGHAGLVPQPNDTDFIDAKYKVKTFLKEIATKRVGLFFYTRSKSLEVIGDLKNVLPECLKNKVFHLYVPGQPKRTH